ncbi:MAG TPA: hypothetical protein VFA65_22700 [Bryobacteraceae bacterium]|nr:hypothetical protein [Bryobacteraceae bacterium]
MRRLPLVCVLFCLSLNGEIVDRIAIAIGRQVVTELQIDEELRVAAFQNHVPISEDLEARRAAADRIVTQLLVSREMQLSRYPMPPDGDVDRYLAQIRSSFASDTAYHQGLDAYRINETILKRHLADQLAILSFVELRFRPTLDVSDSEIRSFYDRELATWKTDHPGIPAPSFDAARPAIRKTLTEKDTDQILDAWLEEARKQVNIIYLDKALR